MISGAVSGPEVLANAAEPDATGTGGANAFDELIAPRMEVQLRFMAELLAGVERVALVDYPVSGNVGDSMIWLGQVALFRRLGKKIVYVDAGWHSDDVALRKVVDQGAAIIIMGGGNFGTVWPHHHQFREHLLQTFPDSTIVQMPQSICFADEEALAKTRDIIAACEKFHLLVRDFASLNFARKNFEAPIELCPDSAFFLGLLDAPRAEIDVVYLQRTDRESSASSTAAPTPASMTIERTDWLKQDLSERLLNKLVRNLLRFRLLRNTSALTFHLYNLLAWARIRRGIRVLARGRVVITDRLHAHVLCMLIGRRHLLLDNGIGKIFAFHEAWTQRWPLAAKAETTAAAIALAEQALQAEAANTCA